MQVFATFALCPLMGTRWEVALEVTQALPGRAPPHTGG